MLRRLFAVLLTLVAIAAAGWLSLRRADIPFETLEAAYTSPDSDFVSLDSGYMAHFRDRGPIDAPVILFVHGFAGSLHAWEPLVDELGTDYRLISVDLPGHGLTRGFDSDSISIDGFVDFLDAFTTRLGVERVTLVGYSMGGAAASSFALQHPDRVEGLVLIGATDWPPAWMNRTDRALIVSVVGNTLARRAFKDLDVAYLLSGELDSAFHDPSFVTKAMTARRTALNRAPGHREALLALAAPRAGAQYIKQDSLRALGPPAFIAYGEEDPLAESQEGERFAESLPNAEYRVYREAGRMPHIEAAGRLAKDMRVFLKGETRADPGLIVRDAPILDARSPSSD